MNKTFFLLLGLTIVCAGKTQNNYNEAITQGDAAFANGQYKTAINKYFAAQAFDPSKREIVKGKVNEVFDKIENLRQDAIKAQIQADKAKYQAENALDSLKKQQVLVKNANARADSASQELYQMKETMIGAKYGGGIVFYWNDKTGKHGLIAAESDLGEFKWQQAMDTCKKVQLNGYSDWRLPNKDELGALYVNANVIGGFEQTRYWSSTEVNNAEAFCESFDYGTSNNYAFKSLKFRIRLVRYF